MKVNAAVDLMKRLTGKWLYDCSRNKYLKIGFFQIVPDERDEKENEGILTCHCDVIDYDFKRNSYKVYDSTYLFWDFYDEKDCVLKSDEEMQEVFDKVRESLNRL